MADQSANNISGFTGWTASSATYIETTGDFTWTGSGTLTIDEGAHLAVVRINQDQQATVDVDDATIVISEQSGTQANVNSAVELSGGSLTNTWNIDNSRIIFTGTGTFNPGFRMVNGASQNAVTGGIRNCLIAARGTAGFININNAAPGLEFSNNTFVNVFMNTANAGLSFDGFDFDADSFRTSQLYTFAHLAASGVTDLMAINFRFRRNYTGNEYMWQQRGNSTNKWSINTRYDNGSQGRFAKNGSGNPDWTARECYTFGVEFQDENGAAIDDVVIHGVPNDTTGQRFYNLPANWSNSSSPDVSADSNDVIDIDNSGVGDFIVQMASATISQVRGTAPGTVNCPLDNNGDLRASEAHSLVSKSYKKISTNITSELTPCAYGGGTAGAMTIESDDRLKTAWVTDAIFDAETTVTSSADVSLSTDQTTFNGAWLALKKDWFETTTMEEQFGPSLSGGIITFNRDVTLSTTSNTNYTTTGYTVIVDDAGLELTDEVTGIAMNAAATEFDWGGRNITEDITLGTGTYTNFGTTVTGLSRSGTATPELTFNSGTTAVRYTVTSTDFTGFTFSTPTTGESVVLVVDSTVTNIPTLPTGITTETAVVNRTIEPNIPTGANGRFSLVDTGADPSTHTTINITNGSLDASAPTIPSNTTTTWTVFYKLDSTVGGSTYRVRVQDITDFTRDHVIEPLEVNDFFVSNATTDTNTAGTNITATGAVGTDTEQYEINWGSTTSLNDPASGNGTQAAVITVCNNDSYFDWVRDNEWNGDPVDYREGAVVWNNEADQVSGLEADQGVYLISANSSTASAISNSSSGLKSRAVTGVSGLDQVTSLDENSATVPTIQRAIENQFDDQTTTIQTNIDTINTNVDSLETVIGTTSTTGLRGQVSDAETAAEEARDASQENNDFLNRITP